MQVKSTVRLEQCWLRRPPLVLSKHMCRTCQFWNMSFFEASIALSNAFAVPRQPLRATAAATVLPAALAAAEAAALLPEMVLLVALLPTRSSSTSCTLVALA